MAIVKPVKVLTDLLTKKQIIKEDIDGNVLFRVTGSLNDGYVSSSLPITASAIFAKYGFIKSATPFNNFNIPTSSASVYSIDEAFHAIDQVGTGTPSASIENTYRKLRYKITGAFDSDGNAAEILPNNVNYTFPVSDIDYINISILTRESHTSSWTNDLIAYEMKISGSTNNEIHILMTAQDIASIGEYKLLAINENGNAFDI